ncbi:membrane protein [Desulfuromonas versatilis]|uniref:Membrane protein n=1 Tax=Desulfuromonas versatilis TaxID=2802975 RepID=A0ABM8HVJ2_9BACT|nr:Bax inhibitor-1/YccA family protein [Desulfuromonas versatilis]BCR04707.1 membrane protein [Desulfuromonas versatilis]
MRTTNPVLKEKVFSQSLPGVETMTLQGAVNKTVALLALIVIGAAWTWNLLYNQGPQAVMPWMMTGLIGGAVVALVTIFKANWAPALAPAYAVLEGLALGGISGFFEARFPGIVLQAVALTFGVAFCLLMAYKSRLIQATQNFRLGIVAATGGIFVVYLAGWIGSFFGWQIPYIHESGVVGIGFSLFVVVIAALNLVLDFDFIERGDGVAPKYMEWYAAFGLVVTLVWLYLELLRLLSKLRSR